MRRLCLLIPDITTTKRIADHMKTNGISDGHIHVLGRSALAIDHLHLNKANLFQTTNLPQALLRGGVIGLILGMLMGVSLLWLSPWGIVVPPTGVVVFTVLGLILGLWISGLVGIGVQNPVVEQNSLSIQQGKYLMIIDLDSEQAKNIAGTIAERFPQAKVAAITLH